MDFMQIRPKKEASIAAITVFIITMICNLSVTMIAKRGMLDSIQEQLKGLVKIAAEETDGDLHQTLTNQEQKNSPDYAKVQSPYRKILKANPGLRYIYTTILKDEKIYFIIDTPPPSLKLKEGERDTTANVMEEYTEATEYLKEALHEHKLAIEDQPYTDEWGTVISAYAPFFNSKNEFVGVVGADISAEDYNARMLKVWLAFGVGALLAAGLATVVYVIVLHIRNEHANDERIRLKRLEAMEEFSIQMKTATELVAKASEEINKMSGNISDLAKISANETEDARTLIRGATGRIQAFGLVCNKLLAIADNLQGESMVSEKAAKEVAIQVKSMDKSSTHLEEATRNISEIVGIIDDIAERTELLALNANIEAARAGDAGKSFAVVADEVKLLARQTAMATTKITQYINDIQSASKIVVDSFSGISERISKIGEKTLDSTKAIDGQRELISLISEDLLGVIESTGVVEKKVGDANNIAQQTEKQTQSLYSSVTSLARQNYDLKTKFSDFLEKLHITPKK